MTSTIFTNIRIRRQTAAEWAAENRVLAAGEPSFESDTGVQKVGDGIRAYNLLPSNATASISDATTLNAGKVKLAGALGGTAATPTVFGQSALPGLSTALVVTEPNLAAVFPTAYQGFRGTISGENFGMNWTTVPINYGFTSPTEPGFQAAVTVISTSTFSASCSGSVMTVTGTPTAAIVAGMTLSGAAFGSGTQIRSLGTGTGGAGTYNLTTSQTAASSTVLGAIATKTPNAADTWSGTEGGRWVRRFFGFDANGGAGGLFAPNSTTINPLRLADLRTELNYWHQRGKKVMVTLDCPAKADAAVMARVRDRIRIVLTTLAERSENIEDCYIDAVSPVNEPVYIGDFNHAYAPELMRIVATQFRTYSPNTIIVSPEYQGGEGRGDGPPYSGINSYVEQFMSGSAVGNGTVVQGDGGGIGTTGEMFCDVIGFHCYCSKDTIAKANTDLTASTVAAEMFGYTSPIKATIARRRVANQAYWNGRTDPELWNTEYNLTGSNLVSSNDRFRFQYYTKSQRAKFISDLLLGGFVAGFSKQFIYSADSQSGLGPWAGLTFSTNSKGELRITSPVKCYDGDALQLLYGSVANGYANCYAYNASPDGLQFDAKGIPSTEQPAQMKAFRWGLAGFNNEFPEVIAMLSGYFDSQVYATGNSADPFVPQFRIAGGQVQRAVAGKLGPI